MCYQAKVTSNNLNYQEKVSFVCPIIKNNLREYKNKTELSNEIWEINDSGNHAKVKWE